MYRNIARWTGIALVSMVLVFGSFVENNFGLTQWRAGSRRWLNLHDGWPSWPTVSQEMLSTKVLNTPLDTVFMWIVVGVILLLMREHLTFELPERAAPEDGMMQTAMRRFKALKHPPATSMFPKRHRRYRLQPRTA